MSRALFRGLRRGLILAGLSISGTVSTAYAEESQTRLIFTGDVLLGREVQREIRLRKGESPWSEFASLFKGADWLMGNFEGSVGGSADCITQDASPCFAVEQSALNYLQGAGFAAMGIENNHSADLGEGGRVATRGALQQAGIVAIDFKHSPGYVKIHNRIFAFIAVNNAKGGGHARTEIPSNELRQKIRVAKALADWVIVNVHWGVELSDYPQPEQRDMAKWMIEQGADVIIGHHPHVIQTPECILGKPVFFSMGNHVFDQKYAETKRGLMAVCTVQANRLSCSDVGTKTPMNSSFPEISMDDSTPKHPIETCSATGKGPLVVGGYAIRPRLTERQFTDAGIALEGVIQGVRRWDTVSKRLLGVEKGRLAGKAEPKEYLFTLEQHHSSIDHEMGVRPYVYEVSVHGLVARWRGSALAWPLVDARLLRNDDMDYLCALHRTDSFIELAPGSTGARTAVYKWNGFGFSGVDTPGLLEACEKMFLRKAW